MQGGGAASAPPHSGVCGFADVGVTTPGTGTLSGVDMRSGEWQEGIGCGRPVA